MILLNGFGFTYNSVVEVNFRIIIIKKTLYVSDFFMNLTKYVF